MKKLVKVLINNKHLFRIKIVIIRNTVSKVLIFIINNNKMINNTIITTKFNKIVKVNFIYMNTQMTKKLGNNFWLWIF